MGKKYSSRKSCKLEFTSYTPFFSLVDFKNNLIMSNDIIKIERFYDSFESANELVNWMKERPKGVSTIYEVEGNKDIIVVIPTSDFNGKYAKECRENIFKSLHIIFVESGEREDLYFNYAHNVNVGIKKAMEYNPKWIIVSNDDMFPIDDELVLKDELLNIDNKKILYVKPDVEMPGYISRHKKTAIPMKVFLSSLKPGFKYDKKFGNKYHFYGRESKILKKLLNFLFIKSIVELDFMGYFMIISSEYCKIYGTPVYDETYINSSEDVDLCIRLLRSGVGMASIKYKIGYFVGKSLGSGKYRSTYREIMARTYLNYKFHNYLDSLSFGKHIQVEMPQ